MEKEIKATVDEIFNSIKDNVNDALKSDDTTKESVTEELDLSNENVTNETVGDGNLNDRNVSMDYMHRPLPPRPYSVLTPSYLPIMNYKRFMDNSIDMYNQTPTADYHASFGYYDTEDKVDKRIKELKRKLTVEQWDILNGTNFMSDPKQITRYIGIIKSLLDVGIFGPLTAPQTVLRPKSESRPADVVLYGSKQPESKAKHLGVTTTNISELPERYLPTITIDGEEVEAKPGDTTTYGDEDYAFNGTRWYITSKKK